MNKQGTPIKGISLTQPWAQLVALGAKQIETRSFQRSYRGPLAIHAAKGLGPVGGKRGYKQLCFTEPFLSVLSLVRQNTSDVFYLVDYFMSLPLGAIVAVCELVDCAPTANVDRPGATTTIWRHGESWWLLTDQERAFGDYSAGRYAWLLANIRALPEPIHCPGALGLWELDAATLAAVERQLEVAHDNALRSQP